MNAETQFTNGIYKRNKRTNNHIPLAGENSKKKARKEDTHTSNQPEEEDELNEEEDHEEEEEEDDDIKLKKEHDVTLKDESKETDTKSNVNKAIVEAAVKLEQESINNESNTQEAQAQLQAQLQNTIRQHLLDPVRYSSTTFYCTTITTSHCSATTPISYTIILYFTNSREYKQKYTGGYE